MIDRRIVVKMLITYFEKDHAGGWEWGQAQSEGMAWVSSCPAWRLPVLTTAAPAPPVPAPLHS
jgi:hypothetical protein